MRNVAEQIYVKSGNCQTHSRFQKPLKSWLSSAPSLVLDDQHYCYGTYSSVYDELLANLRYSKVPVRIMHYNSNPLGFLIDDQRDGVLERAQRELFAEVDDIRYRGCFREFPFDFVLNNFNLDLVFFQANNILFGIGLVPKQFVEKNGNSKCSSDTAATNNVIQTDASDSRFNIPLIY